MALLSQGRPRPPAVVALLARLAGFALVAAVAGCSRSEPPPEPLRAVKVVQVTSSPLEAASEFAGEVRARAETQVGFRVGGKVVRRPVGLGERVRAGQVLAELDPQDYRLAADAARAQVDAARTNRDLARADLGRYRELRTQNFISGAELERREASFRAAQASLEQAQAQRATQGNQAAYTTLLADAAGVVTAVQAEPGQVVAAGTPVFRIAQDGPRDVVFSVPEDKVAMLAVGTAVNVRTWTEGPALAARVREVAASADPVTRTFIVKAGLDAAASAPALGATVYLRPQALSRSGLQAITLPTSALRQEGGRSTVWVLEQPAMTVRAQPVEVATADGNDAVIASGLQPGMLVVAAGVHVLSPGQKVTIYQGNVPAAQVPPGRVATESIARRASATTADARPAAGPASAPAAAPGLAATASTPAATR